MHFSLGDIHLKVGQQHLICQSRWSLWEKQFSLIIHDGADYDLDVDFATTFNYYALWERNKYKLKIEASENYTPSIADPYVRDADFYYN